jgi:hypothetical protein
VKKASDVDRADVGKSAFWSVCLDSCEPWPMPFLRHLCPTTTCNISRLPQENIRPVPPVTPKNHRYLFSSEVVPRFRKPHHTLHHKTRYEPTSALPKPKTPISCCFPQHSPMIKITLLCNVLYLGADIPLCSTLGANKCTQWV